MKPLTQEQVDWILDKLKQHVIDRQSTAAPSWSASQAISIENIEKILNKAVSAVPDNFENAFSVESPNQEGAIKIFKHCIKNHAVITIELYGDHKTRIWLEAQQLKQHIDHCQCMLDYLQGEGE